MEEALEESMKSFMRKRVFALLLTNFLGNLELKRIEVQIGRETKLDLSRKKFEDAFKLNSLESISHILLNEIMPMIEKKPSFFSTRQRSICEKEIRGVIDWPRTFKRNLCQGQLIGKEFVVVNPRQEWDTPENLLSMLCLLDIVKNTSYFKRTFRESVESSKWSERIVESRVLDAIAQEGLRRTKMPYFRDMEEEVEELLDDSSKIEELEREFERRVQLNLIRNPGYERVYQWRREFLGQADVQRESTRILRDIPGEGIEYMSKLYEIWTLFEVADVMEEQVQLFKYYSEVGEGPLFTGTLPNPSREGISSENIEIELYYLPAQRVAEGVWRRSAQAKSFLRAFYPDGTKEDRAIYLRGSCPMEFSPGQKRRVEVSVGIFPRFREIQTQIEPEVDLIALPLHPSDDREALNRKLLYNLTKYIRGIPFSSESKGIVLHPATWSPLTGSPGQALGSVEA